MADDVDCSALDVNDRPENFTGWLDGDGHAFFQLNLSANNSLFNNYGGLFHRVQGAHIGNLTFYDSFVSGFEYTGLLAGELLDSVVERVRLMGGTVNGEAGTNREPYAGSVAGRAVNSSLSDIEVAVDVSGGQGVKGDAGARGENGQKGLDADIAESPQERTGGDGGNGQTGEKGGRGVSVGAFIGDSHSNVLERMVLTSNSTMTAGTGGQGGKGGRGGRGGRGGGANYILTDGGDGGNGGIGGDGGVGGYGGRAGLFAHWNETLLQHSLVLDAGLVPGHAGKGGKPGSGGRGGSGGLNFYINSGSSSNGNDGVSGNEGTVGVSGNVTVTEMLSSLNTSSLYWHGSLEKGNASGGYTADQLKQPSTYTDLDRRSWRIQEGFYPYPLALDGIYRPTEPVSYQNSNHNFSYPRLANYYNQPQVRLYSPLTGYAPWSLISVSSFADFLRKMATDAPAVVDSLAPEPDRVFEQWAPEGLNVTAHRDLGSGRHVVLWQSEQHSTGRLTDFLLTGNGTNSVQPGGLAISLPDQPIDLFESNGQTVVVGDDALWRLTPENQLEPLPLDDELKIEKVLDCSDDQFWLLANKGGVAKLVRYYRTGTESDWQAETALTLPDNLGAVQGVIVGQALYFHGRGTNGEYFLYRSEAGNTAKLAALNQWLLGIRCESIRLHWYDNALHLAGHDGERVVALQLTAQGEVIRSATLVPDNIQVIRDLQFRSFAATQIFYIVVAGIDDRGGVVSHQLIVPPLYSSDYQLSGNTIEPLFNHNFTELHRNPNGRFYLAEDIVGPNDASRRANAFMGGLDGRNHAILGLNYTSVPPLTSGGLFHRTVNASIGNLTFYDASISGTPYSGLLAGQSENSLFENLRLIGGEVVGKTLERTQSWAAALVGHSIMDRFRNVEIAINVKGEDGLAGADGADGVNGTQSDQQPSAPAPVIPFYTPTVKVAPDGLVGLPGGNGTDGEVGLNGYPGVHTALLAGVSYGSDYASLISHGNVSVVAGNGGHGGYGGSGGHGGAGSSGGEGGSVLFTTAYQPGYWPGAGGQGGDGGQGGNGGDGGDGGAPGRAGLVIDSSADKFRELIVAGNFTQGQTQSGLGGVKGRGGAGGQVGMPGTIQFSNAMLQPEGFTQPIIHDVATGGALGQHGLSGLNGIEPQFYGVTVDPDGVVYSGNDTSGILSDEELKNADNYRSFNYVRWRIGNNCQPYPVALDPVYESHNNEGVGDSFCYPQCDPDVGFMNQHQALLYKRLWSDGNGCLKHYPFSPDAVVATSINTTLSAEPQAGSNHQLLHIFQSEELDGEVSLVEMSTPVELDQPVVTINGNGDRWLLFGRDSVSQWYEDGSVKILPKLPDNQTHFSLLDRQEDRFYLSVHSDQTHRYGIVRYSWDYSGDVWKPEQLEQSYDVEPVVGVGELAIVTRQGDFWQLANWGQSVTLSINDLVQNETIEQVLMAEDQDNSALLHLLVRTVQYLHWFRVSFDETTLQMATPSLATTSPNVGFDTDEISGVQIFALEGLSVDSLKVLEALNQDWFELEANWQEIHEAPSLKLSTSHSLSHSTSYSLSHSASHSLSHSASHSPSTTVVIGGEEKSGSIDIVATAGVAVGSVVASLVVISGVVVGALLLRHKGRSQSYDVRKASECFTESAPGGATSWQWLPMLDTLDGRLEFIKQPRE